MTVGVSHYVQLSRRSPPRGSEETIPLPSRPENPEASLCMFTLGPINFMSGGEHKGCPLQFNGTQTGIPCGIPQGAICVQRLDDSRNLQFTLVIAFCCVLHR